MTETIIFIVALAILAALLILGGIATAYLMKHGRAYMVPPPQEEE